MAVTSASTAKSLHCKAEGPVTRVQAQGSAASLARRVLQACRSTSGSSAGAVGRALAVFWGHGLLGGHGLQTRALVAGVCDRHRGSIRVLCRFSGRGSRCHFRACCVRRGVCGPWTFGQDGVAGLVCAPCISV